MVKIDEVRQRGTVTVPVAAEILGISTNQYYIGARDNRLPALKIGRRVVVPVQPLLRLIECGEPLPTTAPEVA